jgi:putative ABC transport system permease protein
VIFQLTIACMLLSGAMLIVKQLRFLENRPLGFQKDLIINVPLYSSNLNGIFRQNDSTFRSRLEALRDQIEGQSGVQATTLSSNAPGLGAVYRGTIPEGFTEEDHLFIANMSVDYDFLETYGMDVIAGRGFDRNYGTDLKEAFLVNETAVREFNWESPENALGKTINREGKLGKVIGVVKDFNFASLTTPISGLLMEVGPNQFNTLTVRFENQEVKETVSKIESIWNQTFPEKAFEYVFLDEQLNLQYENFQNFGIIVQIFTVIAILISCLGVYGLVLFVVQKKVKEIGVRKVLGATETHILRLICMDFVWLVLAGFVIAIPLSYYFLSNWLENFTYRTSIDVMSYLISFGLVMMVVGLTVSFNAFKASLANPVDSLRSE